MKKNLKIQCKESFINIQFIIIFISTIFSAILYFGFHLDLLLYVFLLGLLFVGAFIIGFFREVKRRNYTDRVRNGVLKYEPYTVDKKTFLEECKNAGLLYSLIRINNIIYEIVAFPPGTVSPNNYSQYECYINDTKIIGLDSFLHYKFDGVHSFLDLDSIEFLEYNHDDPRKFFVDHIL